MIREVNVDGEQTTSKNGKLALLLLHDLPGWCFLIDATSNGT